MKSKMAGNKNFVHTFRNILVVLSTVLLVAVLVLQWLEIQEYGIWPHIENTVKSLFQPEPAAAAPAVPAAPAEQPAQP